jgi:hypothetical protein
LCKVLVVDTYMKQEPHAPNEAIKEAIECHEDVEVRHAFMEAARIEQEAERADALCHLSRCTPERRSGGHAARKPKKQAAKYKVPKPSPPWSELTSASCSRNVRSWRAVALMALTKSRQF